MDLLQLEAYRIPELFSSANLPLFVNRCQRCQAEILSNRGACDDCLKRGHSEACPSPGQECICGFSALFWADVIAQNQGTKTSTHEERAPESAKKGGRGESPEPLAWDDLGENDSDRRPAGAKHEPARYGTRSALTSQPETQLAVSAPSSVEHGVNSRCQLCGGSGWKVVYAPDRRVTRCDCRQVGKSGTSALEIVQSLDSKTLAAGERR